MSETKTGGGAIGTVLIENERVRVTRWDFGQPEDCTGWHRHDHDYVVVPFFDVDKALEHASITSCGWWCGHPNDSNDFVRLTLRYDHIASLPL